MEPSAAFDSRISDLSSLIEREDFDAVEDIWVELAERPGDVAKHLEQLLAVAQRMAEAGYGDRAGTLLELIVPVVEEAGVAPERTLDLYRLLAKLLPEKTEYVGAFSERFEALHGPSSFQRAYFECSGVRSSGDPRRAIERLETLLRFAPGACVYHPAGWGVGEILEVDPLLKQIKVDLAEKKLHRIAIDAVDSILERLPDDSFRALEYRGGEELRRLASEEPVELIDKLLADFGNPLPLKEIKARLVPEIVPASGWSRWWSGAKSSLRETGFFRVDDRAPYRVEKLETAMSYEDDLLERFRRSEWPGKRQVARMVLRGGTRKFPQAVAVVEEELRKVASNAGELRPALEAALIVAKFDPAAGNDVLREALSRWGREAFLEGLEESGHADDVERFLATVEAEQPDALDETLRQAFFSRSDALRETAFRKLEARDPPLLRSLAEEVLRSPRLSPEACSWLIERRLRGEAEGPAFEPLAGISETDLLGLTLDLLDFLVDRSARRSRADSRLKDAFRRLESILFHESGAFFRRSLEGASLGRMREVHHQLVRSSAELPRHALKLIEILTAMEPGIARSDRERNVWWEENAIYTTQAGLRKKQEEFRVLTQEKIPANFEAVGKAADFGDLSENAEFTSALEEQGHLTKRAAQIEEELKKARIIRPEDVRPGVVGLGSRLRVLDADTNEEFVYSVLGPWDGLPEDGVLNYLSPLGRVFLGRKPGEEFSAELPGGTRRYRILEIGSHFD